MSEPSSETKKKKLQSAPIGDPIEREDAVFFAVSRRQFLDHDLLILLFLEEEIDVPSGSRVTQRLERALA